jgi:hypothetical protein
MGGRSTLRLAALLLVMALGGAVWGMALGAQPAQGAGMQPATQSGVLAQEKTNPSAKSLPADAKDRQRPGVQPLPLSSRKLAVPVQRTPTAQEWEWAERVRQELLKRQQQVAHREAKADADEGPALDEIVERLQNIGPKKREGVEAQGRFLPGVIVRNRILRPEDDPEHWKPQVQERIRQAINPERETRVEDPALPARIRLPPGAVRAAARLEARSLLQHIPTGSDVVEVLLPNGLRVPSIPSPNVQRQRAIRLVSLPVEVNLIDEASGQAVQPAAPITLTLPFDPAALPPHTTLQDLALYFFDEKEEDWVEVPGSTVDTAANEVTATVDHLTIFSVMAKVPWEQQLGENVRYYGATQRVVAHAFLAYFDANGGVPKFGLPITDEYSRRGVTVQYFQYTRLEWHPELGGQVMRGPVGKELAELLGASTAPSPPPKGNLPLEVRYFPETSHYIQFAIKQHFEANGGREWFGFPVTDELVQNGVTVSYFERARLEWHPEMAGGTVLAAPVGDELARLEGLSVFSLVPVRLEE